MEKENKPCVSLMSFSSAELGQNEASETAEEKGGRWGSCMGGGCEIAALLQGRLSSSCLAMV